VNDHEITIVPLCEMTDGQQADTFALLVAKKTTSTKTGKTFYRVTFQDASREVTFPIWGDSPLANDCREVWTVGTFYKLRCVYQLTNFGPQLEIQQIRETTEADREDGFDELMLLKSSRFAAEEMFAALLELVDGHINEGPLADLVKELLEQHHTQLLTLPAATKHHHAFIGGFLEHVLNVTRTCVYLAERYAEQYDDMQPPLRTDLVVAGAILHDIGKVRELEQRQEGAVYTAAGELIGHILLGRDMVRDAAISHQLDAETSLRLEHIIVAHQRLPEWGSPRPPMTPEALIVHYADDLDAKLQMMYAALANDSEGGEFTSRQNQLFHRVYRGSGE